MLKSVHLTVIGREGEREGVKRGGSQERSKFLHVIT